MYSEFEKSQAEKILSCYGQESIDIVKSEGDRGGKIIGHTRSGKPIYDSFNHEGHRDFSKQDHTDAESVHVGLANKLKKRASEWRHHWDEGGKHFEASDTLQKSEGDHGGTIIGHTSTGKPIYEDHNNTAHKDFTPAEHEEAGKVHAAMYNKTKNYSHRESQFHHLGEALK
jgi:hypothetical protein